jgi:hypothetical protein
VRLTGTSEGVFTYRRVALGVDDTGGILPEFPGSRGQNVGFFLFSHIIPLLSLAFITPKFLQPLSTQANCTAIAKNKDCILVTIASTPELGRLVSIEEMFLASAVQVTAMYGAINGTTFRSFAIAARSAGGTQIRRNNGVRIHKLQGAKTSQNLF